MRIDPDACRDPDLLAAEVRRLREAIRRLAEEDATLSVCEGDVTVEIDGTLTDAEREAINWAAEIACADDRDDFALWNAGIMQRLLARLK